MNEKKKERKKNIVQILILFTDILIKGLRGFSMLKMKNNLVEI
jgi:hypothetical protein